jgi:hypothetical protein
MSSKPASRQDITRLLGAVSDHTVVKVLEAGATLDHLEEVSMWIAQEDDILGEERRPLTGVSAQVLDWLERDEGYEEEDAR